MKLINRKIFFSWRSLWEKNESDSKVQYDGTNWLEFSDYIIKKVEIGLYATAKLPELDNLHNILQSIMAMSHIKGTAENPDKCWDYEERLSNCVTPDFVKVVALQLSILETAARIKIDRQWVAQFLLADLSQMETGRR